MFVTVGCPGITNVNTLNITFYPPLTGNGSVPEQTNVTILCDTNSAPYLMVDTSTCMDGAWYPSTPVCVRKCNVLLFT